MNDDLGPVRDGHAEQDQDDFPDSAWEIPEELALVIASYEVIGGTGSPGADDSGVSTLFVYAGGVWVAHTDPGEIEPVDAATVEDALDWFLTRCYPPDMPFNDVWLTWGGAAREVDRERYPRVASPA